MMAMKDSDHVYRGSAYQLARQSRKTEQEVLAALQVLSQPDKKRLEEQEFEGRRIAAVADGWLILNGEKYRKQISEEMKKARNRRAQAAYRERMRLRKNGGGPTAHDRLKEKAEREGDKAMVADLERIEDAAAAVQAEGVVEEEEGAGEDALPEGFE